MQSLPQRIAAPVAVAIGTDRPISGLVYQGMTIAAMLWLLSSLWAF